MRELDKSMKKFQVVVDLYYKYRNSLGFGLLTILTLGGESIFSNIVFKCPCNATWNYTYGMVFLYLPILLLSFLGFMMRGPNEYLLNSCKECSRDFKKFSLFCWKLSWTTFLWPLMWIAMALIEGTFYECASSGNTSTAHYLCSELYTISNNNYENCTKELPLVPCKTAKKSEVQDLLKVLKARAQVNGWILVSGIILIFLINACIKYANPDFFEKENFLYVYKQRENAIFQIQAIEQASELAKQNVNLFFKRSSSFSTPNTDEKLKSSSTDEDLCSSLSTDGGTTSNTKPRNGASLEVSNSYHIYNPTTKDWDNIHPETKKEIISGDKIYYSKLHKYVDDRKKESTGTQK